MLRYEITIGDDWNIYTEKEALELFKNIVQSEIEVEKEYLEDEELETSERLEELLEIDTDFIYWLEEKGWFLLEEKVEIIEFNRYLSELLKENGLTYDKSSVSPSMYIYKDDELIRVSNHSEAGGGSWMYRNPDVNLVYRDGRVDNNDIEKYLGIKVEGIILI